MPRRNHNFVVPQAAPQVDLNKLIDDAVARKLVGVAISPFNCRSCYLLSDNDSTDKLCRSCSQHGERPNLLTYAGRKMGFSTGVPSDLLEILGLTQDEIWEASPEDLAALWDRNTVRLLPTTAREEGSLNGTHYSLKIEFGGYETTPPRARPATPSEQAKQLEAARQIKAQDESRRAAARRRQLEDNLQRAQAALTESSIS